MIVPIIIVSQELPLDPKVANVIHTLQQPIIHHVSPRNTDRYSAIAHARTVATKLGLAYDCEYLLFLDADVLPPAWVVNALVATGHDVVGGWIPARRSQWIGGRWMQYGVFRHFKKMIEGIIETDLISLGCTLVHRKLLKGYEFQPGHGFCIDEGGNSYQLADSGAFSAYAKAGGYPLYLTSTVVCEHLI